MTEFGFDVAKHLLGNFQQGSTFVRSSLPSGTLDLSSNEAIHPELSDLWNSYCSSSVPSGLVNSYPTVDDALSAISRLWAVDKRRIILAPGSDDAIKMLAAMLMARGRVLICQVPNYHGYWRYARMFDVEVKAVQWVYSGALDRLRSVLEDSSPSVVVLTNPNGATGEVIELSLIEEVILCASLNGHLFIIDEAYMMYRGVDHSPLLERHENLILLRSFSKTFGLAGLRIAAVLAAPRIIDYLQRWGGSLALSTISLSFLVWCMGRMSQIEKVQHDLLHSRDWFAAQLQDLFAWQVTSRAGNFVTISLGSKAEAKRLASFMRGSGFVVRNLNEFEGLDSSVRITVAHLDIMKDVLIKIGEFTKGAV